jgi:type II secretory pathway component PulC
MNDVLARPIGWVRDRWPDAATLLALALLCWVLARWTWVLFAPAVPVVVPPAPAPIDLQAALDDILRARLFSGQPGATPEPAITTRRDLQLAGVLATAPQGRGWAVLQIEGKAHQVASSGSEIVPGVTLDQVFADHVVVDRRGNRERIDLARRGAAAPAAAPVFGLNVQQRGTGDYAFSRADLDRALREPGQLGNLGALSVSAEAGARIDRAPPGSLAERLGLRPGDVIRSVNGQQIRNDDDLRRLYDQFSQARQTAWVVFEGRRNDAPLRLRYTVQP